MTPKVLISPPEPLANKARLFAALGEWLKVDFIATQINDGQQGDAEIVFCRPPLNVPQRPSSNLCDRLICLSDGGSIDASGATTFSQSPGLSPALRGQELAMAADRVLPGSCTGEVLAGCQAGPLWVRRQEAGRQTDFVSEALPELPPGGLLVDHIALTRWTGVLPLIEFLRRISIDHGWASPPLRACIMFDDPNLHRPKYGFIDYKALVNHAEEHNYHAAMATVPLDAWGSSAEAVALFRNHAARVSLLVHGNNHTHAELARPYSDGARGRLVAQSLERISRLEQRLGLPIPKVMAAPHGACSETMAGELLRQGYEAACISWGSLRKYNPHKVWPPSFGLEPAEFLAGGLPVMPRFRLSHHCHHEVILSAFLDQPLVPVGHHQDLADGLDLLARVSAAINRLGPIRWCNMGEIAHYNFKKRVRGNTLDVRMYARAVHVDLPPAAANLKIERAWAPLEEQDERLQVRFEGGGWISLEGDEVSVPSDKPRAKTVDVRSVFEAPVDNHPVGPPALRPWPIVRRILAETRDRLQPLVWRKQT